jgi:hypothetical protein
LESESLTVHPDRNFLDNLPRPEFRHEASRCTFRHRESYREQFANGEGAAPGPEQLFGALLAVCDGARSSEHAQTTPEEGELPQRG